MGYCIKYMYLQIALWQLVRDGVVDMDVSYKANDLGSKHPSSLYLSDLFNSKVVFHVTLLKKISLQPMLPNY